MRTEVKVQWLRKPGRGGNHRWHGRLTCPFMSMEFAWVYVRDGWWRLEVCLDGRTFREVAAYAASRTAMKHLECWISARDRTSGLLIARGADDPRGAKFERVLHQPSRSTYQTKVSLRQAGQEGGGAGCWLSASKVRAP